MTMIAIPNDYLRRVQADRVAKDDFFRGSPHSPIPRHERADFAGLAYYPIDPTLRIPCLRLLSADGPPSRLEIATSDGGTRAALRLGVLRFELEGRDGELSAYSFGALNGSLFVPFMDATSGLETYSAGRYLDLEAEPDGTYALDFNLAYHPYCAYSPSYSCPLTPDENRLAGRIRAGERLPRPVLT